MVPSGYCVDREQSRGGRSRRRHDNINCAGLRIGFDLIRVNEGNSPTGMAAPKSALVEGWRIVTSERVSPHGRLVGIACRQHCSLTGKRSFGDLFHLLLAPVPLSQTGIPDSPMVGDGGGHSQPANTTIAGGAHMVVFVSGHLRMLPAT